MKLLKKLKRLNLRQEKILNQGLGGIDCRSLPEGHLICTKCKRHSFEVWTKWKSFYVTCGCMHCGEAYKFLLPTDFKIYGAEEGSDPLEGRILCERHKGKGFVIIHNAGYISFGCECCNVEVIVDVTPKGGADLIVAN